MALKFFWRCEGTTLDGTHDFTAGDNIANLLSSAVINTDAARVGTNGLDIPSTLDVAGFTVSSGDLISNSVGAIGLWVRITTFGDGFGLFVAWNSGAPNSSIRLSLVGADTATGREVAFRIRENLGGDKTITTTDADLALDTWYFLVARYNQVASDMRLEIYNNDLSFRTAVEDLTNAFDAPSGINEMFFGDWQGVAGDIHIDNAFIADAYDEPLEDNGDITSYTEYGVSSAALRSREIRRRFFFRGNRNGR